MTPRGERSRTWRKVVKLVLAHAYYLSDAEVAAARLIYSRRKGQPTLTEWSDLQAMKAKIAERSALEPHRRRA